MNESAKRRLLSTRLDGGGTGVGLYLSVAVAVLTLSTNPCHAGSSPESLNAAVVSDLPQTVLDTITSKVAAQTTLVELGPTGIVRWSARAIRLVEFVKVRSPTDPDVYLFAMRYAVSVMRDGDLVTLRTTWCQATVVYKAAQFSDPTVACGPIDISRQDRSS
jgi:hypothetical protein